MKTCGIIAVLLCCCCLTNLYANEQDTNVIQIERVVGPEKSVRYKHPATTTELDNGDLFIAFYGGDGEYEGDYLLPVYHETGKDHEGTAADTCSYFLRYHGADRSWTVGTVPVIRQRAE